MAIKCFIMEFVFLISSFPVLLHSCVGRHTYSCVLHVHVTRLKREVSSPPICRHAVRLHTEPLFSAVNRGKKDGSLQSVAPATASYLQTGHSSVDCKVSGALEKPRMICVTTYSMLDTGTSRGLHVEDPVCEIQ